MHILVQFGAWLNFQAKKIISCSKDKTIKVWDIETGICLKTLEGHNDQILSIDFED
jgi:WD40 repeat protein